MAKSVNIRIPTFVVQDILKHGDEEMSKLYVHWLDVENLAIGYLKGFIVHLVQNADVLKLLTERLPESDIENVRVIAELAATEILHGRPDAHCPWVDLETRIVSEGIAVINAIDAIVRARYSLRGNRLDYEIIDGIYADLKVAIEQWNNPWPAEGDDQ